MIMMSVLVSMRLDAISRGRISQVYSYRVKGQGKRQKGERQKAEGK